MWWPTQARPPLARQNVLLSSAPHASTGARRRDRQREAGRARSPRERRSISGRAADAHDRVVGARLDRPVVEQEQRRRSRRAARARPRPRTRSARRRRCRSSARAASPRRRAAGGAAASTGSITPSSREPGATAAATAAPGRRGASTIGRSRAVSSRSSAASSIDQRARRVEPARHQRERPSSRRLRARSSATAALVVRAAREMEAAEALDRDDRARVAHHIGDLRNAETLARLRETASRTSSGCSSWRPRSSCTTCTRSTSRPIRARARRRAPRRRAAPPRAPRHLPRRAWPKGPAIGAIYDGTGLGTDGTLSGGELLAGDLGGFERAGHLRPDRLPGGEAAIRQPWRWRARGCRRRWARSRSRSPRWIRRAGARSPSLARGELAAPVRGMGRLFDAVAALAGSVSGQLRGAGGDRSRAPPSPATTAASTR